MDVATPMPAYVVAVSVASVAAVFDVRGRRIPNWIPVAGLAFGLALAGWSGAWAGLAASIAGFALGGTLMLPGYLLGQQGGGDLKLMAALGSLLGPKVLLLTFVLFVVIIGLWALVHVVVMRLRGPLACSVGRYGQMIRRLFGAGRPVYIPPAEGDIAGLRIPAAPAIALAVLFAPLALT